MAGTCGPSSHFSSAEALLLPVESSCVVPVVVPLVFPRKARAEQIWGQFLRGRKVPRNISTSSRTQHSGSAGNNVIHVSPNGVGRGGEGSPVTACRQPSHEFAEKL